MIKTTAMSRKVKTMANQIGKKYKCAKCNAEVMVTKGGNGELVCCNQPMEQKK